MGRKKSPVTRKRVGRRFVDPAASSSSSSASEVSSLLDDVSPSSLRGLAAIKQEPMEGSNSFQLPSIPFQGLNTALPIGEEAPRGRRSRWKRRNSGDDDAISERSGENSSDEEQEEMVTISVAELEKWQQRVILHVEDHFTNEQLKRIAEFGRVHGSIMQEAKQYVSNVEIQLRNQLEQERAALRVQAEDFAARATAENESLRQQVGKLEQQVEGLEKQVDTLEQEVDALKFEKTQLTRQREEEQQGNCERVQQTHSPLNHRTQVQPENGGVNGNGENKPKNGAHVTNGCHLNGQEGSKQLQAPKQTSCGPIGHCSASKTTNPSTCHQADLGKVQEQQQQQQQGSNTVMTAKGTPPTPGVVSLTQERLQAIVSPARADNITQG